ncbi:acid protease [Mycena maculata]|uniref:Acid protease n=1 Tax=Mycena maculata TaxID=230809 RepID=A0AAD7ITM9_9AGAR|nr:acid protease [Mycena maculata]
MSKLYTILSILFVLLLSDVCTALPPPTAKSSQIQPFISLPLLKLRGRADPNCRLAALGTAVVHKEHVRRAVRRLELMSGARPSQPKTTPSFWCLRRCSKKRDIGALGGEIANADNGAQSNTNSTSLIDPEAPQSDTNPAGLTSAHPTAYQHSAPNSTSSVDPEASQSDADDPDANAEVTPAHPMTYPHSAPMDIEANNIGYMVTMDLGTPPRGYRVLVDSGSADLWVGGEECKADDGSGGCGNHRFLGNSSSSSFRDTGKPWDIEYETGSVSGTLVTDRVILAGLTLPNHTFGASRTESLDFTPTILECVQRRYPVRWSIRLRQIVHQSLSMQGTSTLVKAFQSAGLLARNIISYKISRKSDDKNDGELTLGGMDPSKYDASSLVRVKNVNTAGFWEANVTAVKVDGKDVGLQGRSCILDTGTTLLAAPKEDVDVIHSSIPGAEYNNTLDAWTIPCNTTASVSLSIGGKPFPIEPKDLTFLPVDPQNLTGACTSSIIAGAMGKGSRQWLAGDTFLKNVYFSTDEDTDHISVARRRTTTAHPHFGSKPVFHSDGFESLYQSLHVFDFAEARFCPGNDQFGVQRPRRNVVEVQIAQASDTL